MSHRTQITLTDRQYEILKSDAEESGRSMSQLVRRSLDRTYGQRTSVEERLRLVEHAAGVWTRPGTFDTVAEVQKLRRPLEDL